MLGDEAVAPGDFSETQRKFPLREINFRYAKEISVTPKKFPLRKKKLRYAEEIYVTPKKFPLRKRNLRYAKIMGIPLSALKRHFYRAGEDLISRGSRNPFGGPMCSSYDATITPGLQRRTAASISRTQSGIFQTAARTAPRRQPGGNGGDGGSGRAARDSHIARAGRGRRNPRARCRRSADRQPDRKSVV